MNIISKVTKTFFDKSINYSVTSKTIYLFDKISLYQTKELIEQSTNNPTESHSIGFKK